nr:InlB B-repeat-containing protein [bacterium]
TNGTKTINVYIAQRYSISTGTLTNCSRSNSASYAVHGSSYSNTITATSGYSMPTATATNATYSRSSSASRTITYTLSHCSKNSGATTSVTYYASATVTQDSVTANITIPNITATSISGSATITADTGYHLPDSITVTNATKSWTKSSGALSLSVITGNVTVTITAEANALTFNAQTLTAGKYKVAYSQSFTGASNGTGTYTYATTSVTYNGSALSASGGTYNGLSQSGTTISGTPTKPGTYVFTITATDSGSSATKSAAMTITINNRSVTITAKAQSITYGNSISSATSQVTIGGDGLASGDSLSSVTLTPSAWAVTSSGTITPSAASFNVSYYTVSSYATGTLTISKRSITITGASASKDYDGTALTSNSASITSGSLASWDSGSLSASGSQTAVGSSNNVPSITITGNSSHGNGASNAGNYTITTVNGTLTVNGTSATVNIKVDGGAWSASSIKVDLSTSSSSNNATYTATVSSGSAATFSNKPAGTYYVYVGQSSNAKTTMVYLGTVSMSSSGGSINANYYSLTLTAKTGISSVSGGGYYLSGQTATINVTGFNNGYAWNSGSKWTTDAAGSNSAFTAQSNNVTMNAAKSYYAWAVATGYTITYSYSSPYSISGGTTSYNVGTSVTLATLSRTGYTDFKWKVTTAGGNWSLNTEYNSAAVIGTGMYGNVTLTAYSNAQSYTVTLNKDHSDDRSQRPWTAGTASVTATYDSNMPSATAPTRTGYAFGGYYDDHNGAGTQYYTSSMASARTWNKTSATTLYAKWIPNKITVYIYKDGSPWNNSGRTVQIVCDTNSFEYFTITNPTSYEVVFETGGFADDSDPIWVKNGDNSVHISKSGSILTTVTLGTLTIYNDALTIRADYYTVTANRGDTTRISAVSGSNVVLSGQTASLSASISNSTMYKFQKWTTSNSSSATAVSTSASYSPTITAATNYYAWGETKPQYTVDFNGNGGSVVGTDEFTVYQGQSVTAPSAAKTVLGNTTTATGWGTTSNATTSVVSPGGSYTPTASITLYAIYNPGITITLNRNTGGTNPATVSIAANVNWSGSGTSQTITKTVFSGGTYGTLPTGSNITPTNTTSYVWTFTGWYTAASGGTQVTSSTSAPSSATTIYARWTRSQTYAIKFYYPTSNVTKTVTSTYATATGSGYTTFYVARSSSVAPSAMISSLTYSTYGNKGSISYWTISGSNGGTGYAHSTARTWSAATNLYAVFQKEVLTITDNSSTRKSYTVYGSNSGTGTGYTYGTFSGQTNTVYTSVTLANYSKITIHTTYDSITAQTNLTKSGTKLYMNMAAYQSVSFTGASSSVVHCEIWITLSGDYTGAHLNIIATWNDGADYELCYDRDYDENGYNYAQFEGDALPQYWIITTGTGIGYVDSITGGTAQVYVGEEVDVSPSSNTVYITLYCTGSL